MTISLELDDDELRTVATYALRQLERHTDKNWPMYGLYSQSKELEEVVQIVRGWVECLHPDDDDPTG